MHRRSHTQRLSHVVSKGTLSLSADAPTQMSVATLGADATGVKVLAREASGNGYRLQVQWDQHPEPAWARESAVRRRHAAAVDAFTAAAQVAVGDSAAAAPGALQVQAEGQAVQAGGEPMDVESVAGAAGPAAALPPAAALAAEMERLRALVTAQGALLQAMRPAPGGQAVEQSRFAKSLPKATDLPEYDGSARKLDDWLLKVRQVASLYQLSALDTVLFSVSRFTEHALVWWQTLELVKGGPELKERILKTGEPGLTAALKARFQPVTTEATARTQLDALRQGNRDVNEYILEFQHLIAKIPNMETNGILHAFQRGLRLDLYAEVNKLDNPTLAEMISLVSKMDGVTRMGQGNRPAAHQLIHTPGDLQEQLAAVQAQINAMQDAAGGAPRGSPRGGRGRFGGGRGGCGGNGAGRSPRPPPQVPGVPADVLAQRQAAKQCYRCGSGDHHSLACPNAITARQAN